MQKRSFESIGGLNEELSNLVEVDFCLHLREKGLLNIYNPYVQVCDYDEEIEKDENFESNLKTVKEKWNNVFENDDPYYNKNFRTDSNRFKLKKEKVN